MALEKKRYDDLLKIEQEWLDAAQELIDEEERLRKMSDPTRTEAPTPPIKREDSPDKEQRPLEEEEFGDHEDDDAVDADD